MFVFGLQSFTNEGINREIDDVTVTTCNILQYSIKEKWYLGVTSVECNEPCNFNLGVKFYSQSLPSSLKETAFSLCEELELIARDSSNDEGQQAIAAGAQFLGETEHPDEIINRGMERSILPRVPLPQRDWENPIPEHTPGFLQMAFPFIFRSGDADPYQLRPVDIKAPKTTWENKYLAWVAQIPEAQNRPDFQFYLNGRAQRISSRKQVTVALVNAGINRENLPTREEIIQCPEKLKDIASKALSYKPLIEDSDSFWLEERHNLKSCCRYMEDPPKERGMIPMNLSLFQTRATSYNHHPAIHSLFPKCIEYKEKGSESYFKYRLASVHENPIIIQWMHAFMAELDTKIASPNIHGSTVTWYRHEWGANANPHFHRLIMIGDLNEKLNEWVNALRDHFKLILVQYQTIFGGLHSHAGTIALSSILCKLKSIENGHPPLKNPSLQAVLN